MTSFIDFYQALEAWSPLLLWLLAASGLSLATDGLLQLFDFALDEGNVLDRWFVYITQWEESRPKLFKVLGGCIVCCGFWLSLGLFAAYRRLLPVELPWGVIVLYQGLVMRPLVARARKAQRRAAKRKARAEEALAKCSTWDQYTESWKLPQGFTAPTLTRSNPFYVDVPGTGNGV